MSRNIRLADNSAEVCSTCVVGEILIPPLLAPPIPRTHVLSSHCRLIHQRGIRRLRRLPRIEHRAAWIVRWVGAIGRSHAGRDGIRMVWTSTQRGRRRAATTRCDLGGRPWRLSRRARWRLTGRLRRWSRGRCRLGCCTGCARWWSGPWPLETSASPWDLEDGLPVRRIRRTGKAPSSATLRTRRFVLVAARVVPLRRSRRSRWRRWWPRWRSGATGGKDAVRRPILTPVVCDADSWTPLEARSTRDPDPTHRHARRGAGRQGDRGEGGHHHRRSTHGHRG